MVPAIAARPLRGLPPARPGARGRRAAAAYILEADGYAVTIQEWDFRPGSNFAAEMDKALKQCPRMIAVLSPTYLKARFPSAEWTAVFADDPEGAKNALVPIMVEECRPEGLLSQV